MENKLFVKMFTYLLIFGMIACQPSNDKESDDTTEDHDIKEEQEIQENDEVLKGSIKTIDPNSFLKMSLNKNNQLVDIRSSLDFSIERIEFAVNYDFSKVSFLREVQSMDKNTPLLLYDQNGSIVNNAAELLKDEGFNQIFILKGGMDNWKKHEFETIIP